MPSSCEKASGGVPEGPTSTSVLDFLYHDARRVGSFLAQFDDAGHLQQITQEESAGKREQSTTSWRAGAGVPILLGGQMTEREQTAEEGSETSQRIYDPFWANARNLLDCLAHAHLIQRDLQSASIGQFVLVSGRLEIVDLAMFAGMWDDKNFKALLGARDPGLRGSVSRKKGNPGGRAPSETEIGVLLMKMMPHAIQMTIRGEDKAWCNLLRGGLICTTGDLLLMHGGELQGKWHVLGILDSRKDETATQSWDEDNDPEVQPSAGIIATGFKKLTPLGRQLLGRPADAYGLTPLIIFREIVTQ